MEEQKERELTEIRKQLKELLVENLSLEDIRPEDIRDDEVLFGNGLGLDSLDGVEIVVLLQRNYGVQIKDVEQGKAVFYSVDTLSRFVYDNRKQ